MIEPMVCRGFREPYGSWKIIWMSRRSGRICAVLSRVMSRPSKVIRPPVGSWRRVMTRPMVDLPQPDFRRPRPGSPPLRTSKSMPSTAFTAPTWRCRMPFLIGKCLVRSSTLRSTSRSAEPSPADACCGITASSVFLVSLTASAQSLRSRSAGGPRPRGGRRTSARCSPAPARGAPCGVTFPWGCPRTGSAGGRRSPRGTLMRLGGEPLTGMSRSEVSRSMRGIEPSRPQV